MQASLLTQLGLTCVQARASEEQAHRLGNEKAALINTVRKLNRDVAKLDNFKRNLLNSLQADEEVSHIQCASFSAHAIKFLCVDGALENQMTKALRLAMICTLASVGQRDARQDPEPECHLMTHKAPAC